MEITWTIKYTAIAILAFTLFATGLGLGLFFADRPQVDDTPAAVTSTTSTQVVTHKPDGTTVTTSTATVTKPCPTITKKALSQYRLGLNYVRSFTNETRDSFELTAGIRLATTPAFIQAGFNPMLKYATLGLSIEF